MLNTRNPGHSIVLITPGQPKLQRGDLCLDAESGRVWTR